VLPLPMPISQSLCCTHIHTHARTHAHTHAHTHTHARRPCFQSYAEDTLCSVLLLAMPHRASRAHTHTRTHTHTHTHTQKTPHAHTCTHTRTHRKHTACTHMHTHIHTHRTHDTHTYKRMHTQALLPVLRWRLSPLRPTPLLKKGPGAAEAMEVYTVCCTERGLSYASLYRLLCTGHEISCTFTQNVCCKSYEALLLTVECAPTV